MKRKTFEKHLKDNLLKTLNNIFGEEEHTKAFQLKIREPFSSIQTCHNLKDRIFVQEHYLDIELNSKCFLLKAYEDVMRINYHFNKIYENYLVIKPFLDKGLNISISSLLFILLRGNPELLKSMLEEKGLTTEFKIINSKNEEVTINKI